MNPPSILALDIGGTKIFWAVLDAHGAILKEKTEPTISNSQQEALIDQIIHIADSALSDLRLEKFLHLAIATPGLVDHNGKVSYAVNLPLLNTPLKEILQRELKTPAVVENDAKAAALGELHYGAGKGARNFLYVTVGTGIGGAVVLEGELYRGASNIAGEFGHISIDRSGSPCPCGNRGCLDLYASGAAIARNALRQIESGVPSALSSQANRKEAISARLVIDAAKKGDSLSQKIVHDAGENLGIGLVTLIHAFDPEKIVLGGSIVKAGKLLLEPMRRVVKDRSLKYMTKPFIAKSKLGYKAGIFGLASLVLAEK